MWPKWVREQHFRVVQVIPTALIICGDRRGGSSSSASVNWSAVAATVEATDPRTLPAAPKVTVAASSERRPCYQNWPVGCNEQGQQVDGNCVAVTVNSRPAVRPKRCQGWRGDVDGPLPTVDPASSSWAVLVSRTSPRQQAGHRAQERDSIAQNAVGHRHAPADGGSRWLAGQADRLERPVRTGPVAEGWAARITPSGAPNSAHQPLLLDVRSERHDRVLLRRHRTVERSDRRADLREPKTRDFVRSLSPASSTTATRP